MVSQEWLIRPENQKFDVPSLIVDNGKAWGEPKDPEETISAQKRVKHEKKELAARKKVKLTQEGGKLKKGKKKTASKSKDKGKAKAVEVDEEPSNQKPAQPVASTSTIHHAHDSDSDFDD